MQAARTRLTEGSDPLGPDCSHSQSPVRACYRDLIINARRRTWTVTLELHFVQEIFRVKKSYL
jgi:hypothetical protein